MIFLSSNASILDHLQKKLDEKPNTPRKKSLASAIDKVKLVFNGQKQKFTDVQIEELDIALHNTTALLTDIVQIKPTIENLSVEIIEHNHTDALPSDEYRKAMAEPIETQTTQDLNSIKPETPHILNEKISAVRLKLIEMANTQDDWAKTFANDLLQSIIKYGNKTNISNKQLAIIDRFTTPKEENSIETVKSMISKIQDKYTTAEEIEDHKFILDICDQFTTRINQYGDRTIISVKQFDLLKKYAKDTQPTTKKTEGKDSPKRLPNHKIKETSLTNMSARKIKLELFKNYESLRKDKNFMLREKDIIVPFDLFETISSGSLPLAIPDIDFNKFNSDQIQFIKKLYAIIIINIISYGETSLETFLYAENAYKILEDIYSKVNNDVIRMSDISRTIYKDVLSIWDKPTFIHHRYYKCAMFY